MLIDKLKDLGEKPVIGMIHLAGENPVERALEELMIFEGEGVDGAIIEDFHGSPRDVVETLEMVRGISLNLTIGINLLRNPYEAFGLADRFGAQFIQFDNVQTPYLDLRLYNNLRLRYPQIAVMGGVRFKYTRPTGNPLEQDLEEARQRCEAIVTTGSGTGIETPIEKLREFRRLLPDFPLIVGAGVNLSNVYEQLSVADGAIVGSYFKDGDTTNLVDRQKVRDLMHIARGLRS